MNIKGCGNIFHYAATTIQLCYECEIIYWYCSSYIWAPF